MKREAFSKIKEIKGVIWIVIALVLGICFIIAGGIVQKRKNELPSAKEVFSYSDYEKNIEERVAGIVSKVGGVYDVCVMVTLDSALNYSYAENDKGNSSEYVTVRDKDGNESGVLISENTPKIRGVAVVCGGGEDPNIRLEITKLVSALLNIPQNKVYVGGR
jgi:stage III sporulation protein AG